MFTFFEKIITPFSDAEPPTVFSSLSDFIKKYSDGLTKYLFLLAALVVVVSVVELMLFRLLGLIVDWMTTSNPQTMFVEHGKMLMFAALLVIIVYPLFFALQNIIANQVVAPNYSMQIRWLAHKFLLSQSYSFYQHEFAGSIATRLMQTADAIREAVMKIFGIGVYITISFSGVLVLMLTLHVKLALLFGLWTICYFALLGFFLPRIGNVATDLAHARSQMTGRLVDTYTNFTTVKLFSHHRHELDYARESMQEMLGCVHPQMRLATMLSISLCMLNSALLLSVAAMSLWLWKSNLVTAGATATATALVLRLFGMSQWIIGEVAAVFQNLGTAKDGMHLLSEKLTIKDSDNADALKNPYGEIQFQDVLFNYNKSWGTGTNHLAPILNNFSLNIISGEKIGLVGLSGAGKSTIVNLLLRLFDPESGKISIGGQDIRYVDQESLRLSIGMVSQDPSLLHRSIEENLLYGNPKATKEQMIRAAKQAKAHDFIMGQSDREGNTGYQTQVGERGITLSGGQRQRIAIARVLLKDAPILILDEATSALDSDVEAAIQDNLQVLMEGKTVIAIAHRLSTIAKMDRLIVLDKGKIIESGTHRALLQQGGLYAQLWARQSFGLIGE